MKNSLFFGKRPHLVCEFKHIFSVFKQYYMYFHTFSPTRIFKKIESCYLNTRTKCVETSEA